MNTSNGGGARHADDGAWPAAWPESDDALADAIGLHARTRIARGEFVSLREYLDRVPRIRECPVALDIAIEAALTSAAGVHSGRRDVERAGRTLAAEYPELRDAILESATLSALMCSTGSLRERMQADLLPTPPCEFGPMFTRSERRFRLVGLLGIGAHGAVYLAVDRALSDAEKPAQVAIKIMLERSDDGGDSPAAPIAIEEGAKARRVDHPNVVRVYDAGITDEGLPYLVTEYLPGGSLRKGRSAAALPAAPRAAATLAAAIAEGVQALHSAGLIHFDLKPDNVLMTDAGEPKVADLSLAVRDSDRLLSEHGAEPTAGTIGFMAPEQLRGQLERLDARCDVYALGGILFWLLTGEFPNRVGLVDRWTFDENRAASKRAAMLASTPRDLRAIVLRALDADPERRHSTAAQFAEDLRLFLATRPIPWTRPGPRRVASLWARRRPLTAVALVAMLVAASGAGAAFRVLDQRAQRKALEARVAAAKLQAETEWKAQAPKILGAFRGKWNSLKEQGIVNEAFALLWAVEYLLGPGFLNNLEHERLTQQERLTLLQEIFRDSVRTQGADAVESLVYGASAAQWALLLDQPDDAQRALALVEEAWRPRLASDDRWCTVLDVLGECASVAVAKKAGEPAERLAPRVEQLAALDARLARMPDAAPLRLLISKIRDDAATTTADASVAGQ